MSVRTCWILLKSLGITLWFSLVSIYQSRFGSREDINHSMRQWSRALLKTVQVRYTIHNPNVLQPLPNHSYIIMSNHASLYDIPLIFVAFPGSIRMIAKKELFRVPVWGHAMKAAEFLSIDRKNSKQALEDLSLIHI